MSKKKSAVPSKPPSSTLCVVDMIEARECWDLHDFPLGRFNRVPPRVPLQPLRKRYEIRVAIWVLQKCRLPVSTIEDEFGAAHTRCCGGPVVVHDRDQRLQRIPVIPPRATFSTRSRPGSYYGPTFPMSSKVKRPCRPPTREVSNPAGLIRPAGERIRPVLGTGTTQLV